MLSTLCTAFVALPDEIRRGKFFFLLSLTSLVLEDSKIYSCVRIMGKH